MNPVRTTAEYLKMKSSEKKRFVKEVLKMANKDQQALIVRYDRAVARKEIKPVR